MPSLMLQAVQSEQERIKSIFMKQDGDLRQILDIIQEYRLKELIPSRRNVAVARVQINPDRGAIGWGEDLVAVSGTKTPAGSVPMPEDPLFEAFEVPPGHDRRFDTEYKLLEAIASRCTPEAIGLVTLVTERSPCPSCASVIQQFRERFPGIQLTVLDRQGQTH